MSPAGWPEHTLLVDASTGEVRLDGRPILDLGRSHLLGRLLREIAGHGPELDRAGLYEAVWELPHRSPSSDNALYVAIRRLRERLAGSGLELLTLEGGRYGLQPPVRLANPAPAVSHGLLEPASPFFGREDELATLRRLLDGEARLITLTGPGGVGKTRLASHLLAGAERASLVVDLGPATRADEAWERIAAGRFSLSADAVRELGDALLAAGSRLLILDGCEHLVEVLAPAVQRWLARAPVLRILVISRVSLGIPDEIRLPLEPLPVESARALFLQRARAVRPDLGDDPETRALVDRLVDRLDRLPLALELAAARAGSLDLAELDARLARSIDLLRAPDMQETPRHRTLEACIAGSWELLTPEEQRVLAGCAVFRGGFSAEAAEAVLSAEADGPSVLDMLQSLRDRSLLRTFVSATTRRRSLRLDLYDTVRSFVLASDRGMADVIAEARRRHARWFMEQGEARVQALCSPQAAAALDWLQAEDDNLRLAVGSSDLEIAARCALVRFGWLQHRGGALEQVAALERVDVSRCGPALATRVLASRVDAWKEVGRREEALEDARQALEHAGSEPALRALAQLALGTAIAEEDPAEALSLARAALAGAEAAGDRLLVVRASNLVGILLRWAGRPAEALQRFEAARDLARRIPAPPWECLLLNNGSIALIHLQRFGEARAWSERALELAELLDLRTAKGLLVGQMGAIHRLEGDLDLALEWGREAVALRRAAGELSLARYGEVLLAQTLVDRDELDEALQICHRLLAEGCNDDPALRAQVHLRAAEAGVLRREPWARERAGQAAEDFGDVLGGAGRLHALGLAIVDALLSGDLPSALGIVARAEPDLAREGGPSTRAVAMAQAGWARAVAGQVEAAALLFERASRLATIRDRVAVQVLEASLDLRRQDRAAALQRLELATRPDSQGHVPLEGSSAVRLAVMLLERAYGV